MASAKTIRSAGRHGRRATPARGGVAGGLVGWVVLAAMPAGAAPLRILPLGDSLTNGVLNEVQSDRGYTYYLEELLLTRGALNEADYDLLGGRSSASAEPLSDGSGHDLDRWAADGGIAAGTPNSNGFIGGGNDLVNHLQTMAFDNPETPAYKDGVFTTQTPGGEREARVADVVLLHIGTNTLVGDSDSKPRFGDWTVDEADGQFRNLLSELRAQWDAGNIARNGHIIVSQIVPKATNSGGGAGADDDTVRNTAVYNQRILDAIADLPTATTDDAAFRDTLSVVDMFKIEITPGLLASLGLIDDTPLNTDGDGYVDWVDGLDEADPQSFNDSTVTVNAGLLLGDKIHLMDLGNRVMAGVWFDALEQLPGDPLGIAPPAPIVINGGERLVPEPASAVVLAVGALWLARRRTG